MGAGALGPREEGLGLDPWVRGRRGWTPESEGRGTGTGPLGPREEGLGAGSLSLREESLGAGPLVLGGGAGPLVWGRGWTPGLRRGGMGAGPGCRRLGPKSWPPPALSAPGCDSDRPEGSREGCGEGLGAREVVPAEPGEGAATRQWVIGDPSSSDSCPSPTGPFPATPSSGAGKF